MNKTQRLLKLFNNGTLSDVAEHYRYSKMWLETGCEQDDSRRIYAVSKYILRRHGFFASREDIIQKGGWL